MRRRPWFLELLTYVASALATLVATAAALQLWRADWRVPFTYWGDAVAVATHFKTVIETGWYEAQPRLGAPVGQIYHDFPTADNLHFVAARVASWFTQDYGLAMNAYYVAGFVLAAVAAVWFLRVVRVSRTFTVALSVLFALAPYHFIRAEGHLWLASYYALPLGLVVVVRALRGDPLWGRRPGVHRGLDLLVGRGASTVVCLALVGTSSTYYGLFVLMFLAVGGLAAWIRDRDWRRLAGAAVGGVVLLATLLANMAPDLLYRMAHGPSVEGLVRGRAETELYALKLTQLLLPTPGHRVPFLREARGFYDSVYPLPSEQPSLGAVAAFGFVSAVVLAVVTLAGRSLVRTGALTPEQQARTRTLSHLSLLVLVGFLFATVGGLSTLVSFLTPALRGANRMSIVIAAFSLATVGVVLDAWLAGLARRWHGSGGVVSAVSVVAALGLVGVGFVDQVTPGAVPDYAGTRAQYLADEAFFGQVQRALPSDGLVFDLPYIAFPEGAPVNGVFYTEQLKAYLHTMGLRFSAGGIKGRASSDWPEVQAAKDPAEMSAGLAAVGFDAILVDHRALGSAAAEVDAGLAAVLGAPTVTSADGRWSLYPLAAERAEVEAGLSPAQIDRVAESVVGPVVPYPGEGTAVVEPALEDEDAAWRMTAETGVVTLDNSRDETISVRMTSRITSPDQSGSATFHVGDVDVPLNFVGGLAMLDAVLEVPPGRTVITLTASGGWVDIQGGFTFAEEGVPQLVR